MPRLRKTQPLVYDGKPIVFDAVASSEHHVQTRFVVMCQDHMREYPELWGLHATPNGGKRSYMTGVILKAEGVKAGYPDVSLDAPRSGYHGWRCEFKYSFNLPSPEQEKWIAFLRGEGYYVCVYWSADEALRDVIAYLDEGQVEALRLPHSIDCGAKYPGCAPDCPQAVARRAQYRSPFSIAENWL